MDKEQLENSLNQALVTLESIGCVANMLADQLKLPEGPIADSLQMLAKLASNQISDAFRYMRDGSKQQTTEVANG
ncbi:MAG: hypothetical protein ACREXY_03730 [Gammaproteobacteria bacterium]